MVSECYKLKAEAKPMLPNKQKDCTNANVAESNVPVHSINYYSKHKNQMNIMVSECGQLEFVTPLTSNIHKDCDLAAVAAYN
jgi:hypothetical protein